MPPSGRLADLEKNLELLYESLGAMERGFIFAYDPEAKNSIKQRIREEIKPQIRQTEVEYWQLLAHEVNSWVIDDDANSAIIEVIQATDIIKQNDSSKNHNELIQHLTKIQNKLNEPGKSSSAKLKAAIPLFPPFVSYEVELETQGILQRLFPTFSRLLRKVRKK